MTNEVLILLAAKKKKKKSKSEKECIKQYLFHDVFLKLCGKNSSTIESNEGSLFTKPFSSLDFISNFIEFILSPIKAVLRVLSYSTNLETDEQRGLFPV